VLCGASVSVEAGEFGPASRETVSISITIAPRASIKLSDKQPNLTCVQANGLRTSYRLLFISADELDSDDWLASKVPPPKLLPCDTHDSASLPAAVARPDGPRTSSNETGKQAMLLIVPE
jgi:hypothetical protein